MRARSLRLAGGVLCAAATLTTFTAWADSEASAVIKKKTVAASKDETDAKARPRAQWLRVEITEGTKGHREPTVTVRAPLALLRLFGKDATISLAELGVHTPEGAAKRIAIAEIFDALEPGSTIVEVDDPTSHIKVWLE